MNQVGFPLHDYIEMHGQQNKFFNINLCYSSFCFIICVWPRVLIFPQMRGTLWVA